MNNTENTATPQPSSKQKRGRAFIVFGSIFTLLSVVLFVQAPTLVPSTMAAQRGANGGGLGATALRGMAIIWARDMAQVMTQAGIFFCIIGLIMIAVGVVREYRRR